VQLWQGGLAVFFQIGGIHIFGQQQLEPIQHFRRGWFFLQPLLFADFVELGQRRGQQGFLDAGVVDLDDLAQRVHLGELDVMEEAAA